MFKVSVNLDIPARLEKSNGSPSPTLASMGVVNHHKHWFSVLFGLLFHAGISKRFLPSPCDRAATQVMITTAGRPDNQGSLPTVTGVDHPSGHDVTAVDGQNMFRVDTGPYGPSQSGACWEEALTKAWGSTAASHLALPTSFCMSLCLVLKTLLAHFFGENSLRLMVQAQICMGSDEPISCPKKLGIAICFIQNGGSSNPSTSSRFGYSKNIMAVDLIIPHWGIMNIHMYIYISMIDGWRSQNSPNYGRWFHPKSIETSIEVLTFPALKHHLHDAQVRVHGQGPHGRVVRGGEEFASDRDDHGISWVEDDGGW